MEKLVGTTRLVVKSGDITREKVDAIVNAANSSLVPGGGVDGAIHRAGGPAIAEEARRVGHCDTGRTVVTGAGKLKAKVVIHTVGPVWYGGRNREPDLLADCYRNSLRAAEERALKSMAFPAISAGAFGYPLKDASRVAIETIVDYLRSGSKLKEVRVVIFGDDALPVWEQALKAAAG